MKEVVVLSGKGGVGKSSLTAALGALLAEKYKLVLADTDVDAPNLSIVLGAELDNSQSISAADKAAIDYERCSRCMACRDVCRFSSIIGDNEPIIVDYSCEGCGACSLICPEEAISIGAVENGTLDILHSGAMKIVAGGLEIGASSSGRLVDVVKQRARQEAESAAADLLLIDGPPGIGCPVIASLKDADYVILVTEPTPSALSDLKRVVEVVRFFKVPVGVVLNRANICTDARRELFRYLKNNDLDLLVEIPYDLMLPEALAREGMVVTLFPDSPASVAIRDVSRTLDKMIAE